MSRSALRSLEPRVSSVLTFSHQGLSSLLTDRQMSPASIRNCHKTSFRPDKRVSVHEVLKQSSLPLCRSCTTHKRLRVQSEERLMMCVTKKLEMFRYRSSFPDTDTDTYTVKKLSKLKSLKAASDGQASLFGVFHSSAAV